MLYDFMLSFFGLMETIWNMILNISREDIGYISTLCLGLCSFPLFWKTIQEGHCKGMPFLFILAWFIGDMTGIYYILPLGKIPLYLNYGANTIMAGTMLIFKIRKG